MFLVSDATDSWRERFIGRCSNISCVILVKEYVFRQATILTNGLGLQMMFCILLSTNAVLQVSTKHNILTKYKFFRFDTFVSDSTPTLYLYNSPNLTGLFLDTALVVPDNS